MTHSYSMARLKLPSYRRLKGSYELALKQLYSSFKTEHSAYKTQPGFSLKKGINYTDPNHMIVVKLSKEFIEMTVKGEGIEGETPKLNLGRMNDYVISKLIGPEKFEHFKNNPDKFNSREIPKFYVELITKQRNYDSEGLDMVSDSLVFSFRNYLKKQ